MHAISHDVWIDAPREAVFEAICTREGLDGWWGPVASVGNTVGSLVEFDHGHDDLLRMRITDLEPNTRLVWKCVTDFADSRNPASEWLGTHLAFELEDGVPTGFAPLDSAFQRDRFTILRFLHGDWSDDSKWFGFCNFAWGVTLSELSRYCTDISAAETPGNSNP